jgi:type II secretory pathway component PulK
MMQVLVSLGCRSEQAGKPPAGLPGEGASGRTQRQQRRPAMVLLAVLVVITVLSLAAYQYSDLTLSEYAAADHTIRTAQALAFAQSGVQYAAALLSDPSNFTNLLQNNPYDNPAAFRDILIQPSDLPYYQGRFSIVAPPYYNPGPAGATPFFFGVVDESSKINLNTLLKLDPSGQTAYNVLVLLPNMTPDLANAILDWLDSDANPRTGGAENETYTAQAPPYQAKNGPLDSIEELLLVQGMTPQILFGNDANRNGMLDPGEESLGSTCDPGLAAYLTIYTREFNWDSQGNPRIYVNNNDLNSLYSQLQSVLDPNLAKFIILYRQYGPASSGSGSSGKNSGTTGSSKGAAGAAGNSSTGTPAAGASSPTAGGSPRGGAGDNDRDDQTAPSPNASAKGSSPTTVNGSLANAQLDLKKKATTQIASLYDLINAAVVVPSPKANTPATRYASPLTSSTLSALLPTLLDKVTTSSQAILPGRVNVNTAPAVVLSALPGMTTEQVQAILAARPDPSALATADPLFQTPAWLLLQAGFTPQQMKQLENYITTRTQVYRVQVLAYFDEGPTFARVEAVIDTNGGRPRILFQRDLSELGKGFDLSQGQ